MKKNVIEYWESELIPTMQFALNKTAQKVAYNPTQEAADPEPTTPSGGDNTPDPNEGGSNEE